MPLRSWRCQLAPSSPLTLTPLLVAATRVREPLAGTTTMPCTSSDERPSACRLQVSPASSLRKAPSISTPTHTPRGAIGSGMMVVMRVNSITGHSVLAPSCASCQVSPPSVER